jgi:hypothetical protein
MNRSQRILALLALTVLIVAPLPAPADDYICGMYCDPDLTCAGPYWPTWGCKEKVYANGRACMGGYVCDCDPDCGGGGGGGECFDDPNCIFLY